MFYYSDELLERLLTDDAPLGDLTTAALGIGGEPGRMTFMPRRDGRVSGLSVASGILRKLGLTVSTSFSDGGEITAGTLLLEACGKAAALHLGWKVCQNVMEWASGVATYTAAMLAAGRAKNPRLHLASTRKSVPGTRPLAQAAVLHGGGIMHRGGLSETVLLFAAHRRFCENPNDFAAHVAALRRAAPEKKIIVEADNMLEVRDIISAAPEFLPDVLQLDKFPPRETAEVVALARREAPGVLVAAAGGVNLGNIADYAAAGVELVVSSAPYYAAPLDIKVRMEKAG